MRVQTIGSIFVILLALDSFHLGECSQKKINTDFLNLLSSKTSVRSSQDAIQSVLTLLQDLQGANEEAQEKADDSFAEYEQAVLRDINDFSGVVNVNSASVAAAQEDLDAIELKVSQTGDYLTWNDKRYKSNENKLENLAEQRCEANSLFIDTLREYKNALSVLDWVHKSAKSDSLVQKPQIGEYAEKLSKYANLFEEQALTDFVRLGEEEKAMVSIKSRQDGGDLSELLVKDIIGLVQSLIDKLREAIKGLEEQEIKSANDFADFKTNLLAEQESLKQEFNAKNKFLSSLQNDRELANDILNKKKEILENSMGILSLTQDEYNEKKSCYTNEKLKRHEENQLLDEALLIYTGKIQTVNEYLKQRVNEYVGDSLLEEHMAIKKQEPVNLRKGKYVQESSDDDY